MSMKFSNGQTAVTVYTIGELISELQLIDQNLPVEQGFDAGCDIVIFNIHRDDAHVRFEDAGDWVDEEDDEA